MASCSMAPPGDLLPDASPAAPTAGRPANMSDIEWCRRDRTDRVRSFSPRHPAADGWMGAIWANQFPASCERFLLVEDDMAEKGLGSTANYLVVGLLYALRQNRVFLEIP
eukprot:279160-Prymnesium_polylepis.1